MAAGEVDHGGHRRTWVGQPDIPSQFEQAEDRQTLIIGGELLEGPGEMNRKRLYPGG
jgi:hypothetical protein